MMALLTKRNPEMPPEAEIPVVDPMLAINVYADLLPREILEARKGKRQRNLIIGALVLLVVSVFGTWGGMKYMTSKTQDDIDAANARTHTLQTQIDSYKRLTETRTSTTTITNQLKTLMAQDVQWADLVHAVRAAAPAGLSLSSLDASVTTSGTGASAGQSAGGLNAGVGVLTVTGVADSRDTIAGFILAVGNVPGLAGLNPASTGPSPRGVQFTAAFVITSKMYGSCYTSQSPSPTPQGCKK